MLNQLLETIIQILTGWVDKFTSHAQHVEDKLDSLDQTASDIKTNTEPISDIADNTGAVITPIQNIKANSDSIKQSSQTSANNTTAILNNISTLSTNTGRAAAYAQDCANNTLDIKAKVTTIASDTTQLRADTAELNDMSDKIYEAIKWSLTDKIITETVEGTDTVSFDTDLANDLVLLEIGIKAKQNFHGYEYPWIGGAGKNKCQPLNEPVTKPTGITVTPQADGSVIINGTQSGEAGTVITLGLNIKQGISYTASIGNYDTNIFDFGIQGYGRSKKITASSDFPSSGIQIFIPNGTIVDNVKLYPQIEEGSTATSFAPYENICPISGFSTITFNINGTSELINLVNTYYGGYFIQEDEHRKFRITYGYINSYNGETLEGKWICDSAVYEQGINPPLGSEVVYPLTAPIEVQLTPSQIATIKGINTIITDGPIKATYEESIKHYLDKQDN